MYLEPCLAPTCVAIRTTEAAFRCLTATALSLPPNQVRLQAGRHSVRVYVATGGFTLGEIIFDHQSSKMCNNGGT